MTKVIILGNFGCLGHVVERYFREKGYDVIGLNRKDLDVSDFSKLDETIFTNTYSRMLKKKPDYVINCIGILNGYKDVQKYGDINVALPRLLAHIANRDKLWKLIHVSTNCIFDTIGPHNTNSQPNATDLYGMSKALGEINDDWNLTIRTSIIGPELKKEGTGLLHWFMNKSGEEVEGYINALWNGVTTLQLAKFIEECIKNNTTNLVNYHTIIPITKIDLLRIINRVYDLKKRIKYGYNNKIKSSLLNGVCTTTTYENQLKELKEWYK